MGLDPKNAFGFATASSPIAAPISLGSVVGASVTSLSMTTTANAPVGAGILVFMGCTVATTQVLTITDPPANPYALGADAAGPTVDTGSSFLAAGFALGLTFSCTFNGAANPHGLAAFACPGVIASDITTAAQTSSGTATSTINSGVLGQANEILIATIGFSANPGTITQLAGWLPLFASVASCFYAVYYQIVSSTASVAWSATWQNSVSFKTRIFTFKGF